MEKVESEFIFVPYALPKCCQGPAVVQDLWESLPSLLHVLLYLPNTLGGLLWTVQESTEEGVSHS